MLLLPSGQCCPGASHFTLPANDLPAEQGAAADTDPTDGCYGVVVLPPPMDFFPVGRATLASAVLLCGFHSAAHVAERQEGVSFISSIMLLG